MSSPERNPVDLVLAYCRDHGMRACDSFPLLELFLDLDAQGLSATQCVRGVAEATELGLIDVASDRPGYVILTPAGFAKSLPLPSDS
jgi:hypothetical protein